jgi:deoxyuridine 5'-triphosphate nucleotidohydrolase
MKLEFQKLNDEAILPTRGSSKAAGLDLYAVEDIILEPGERAAVRTGLAVVVPADHYGRVAPRSGLAASHGIDVLAGVVDADYRGELRCILVNLGDKSFSISRGERVAQLVIEKIAMLEPAWINSLSATSRNAGGFGSTGR